MVYMVVNFCGNQSFTDFIRFLIHKFYMHGV